MRNKELNEKIKDARREQILSKALLLFATKGLAATKIADISSGLGISQGLVYHYFRSKEEIFTELIKNAFERMNAACLGLEALLLPPVEKIKLAIEELLKGLEENEDTAWYHLLIAQATSSESIPDEARAIITKESSLPYEVISRIITDGQKEGSIKKHDVQDLTLVFWSSMKGLAIHKAAYGKKFKAPCSNIFTSIFLEN